MMMRLYVYVYVYGTHMCVVCRIDDQSSKNAFLSLVHSLFFILSLFPSLVTRYLCLGFLAARTMYNGNATNKNYSIRHVNAYAFNIAPQNGKEFLWIVAPLRLRDIRQFAEHIHILIHTSALFSCERPNTEARDR